MTPKQNERHNMFENAVDITDLVSTGLVAIPEDKKHHRYYEEALERAGCSFRFDHWQHGGFDEVVEEAEDACRVFGIEPRKEPCTRFYLVSADVAWDLAFLQEVIVAPSGSDLCIWCRRAEDTIDEELKDNPGIELLDPFE